MLYVPHVFDQESPLPQCVLQEKCFAKYCLGNTTQGWYLLKKGLKDNIFFWEPSVPKTKELLVQSKGQVFAHD